VRWVVLALLALLLFGGNTICRTTSIRCGSIRWVTPPSFWTRLNLQAGIFTAYALVTFIAIYGAFLALKPARFGELVGGRIWSVGSGFSCLSSRF